MGGANNDLSSFGNTPDFARRNLSTLYTGTKTVTSAGTAERLSASNQIIPSGYTIVIKALLANTGKVRIADSANEAQSASTAFQLSAGESVVLNISDTYLIFVDAAVSGEGVTYIVEAA